MTDTGRECRIYKIPCWIWRDREEFMKKNRIGICVLAMAASLFCVACSNKEKEDTLSGDLTEMMGQLYQSAELSDDVKEYVEGCEIYELTEDMEVSVLGTDEISYTEAVVSMPMMSSQAYQCVLLRTDEDVETIKQQLKGNANPDKWICVSAETVLIESRGNVIFYVMGDNDIAYGLNSAFQKL